MCTTPLQAVIAERIISLNEDQYFDVIFLTSVDNEKHRYYFDRLNKLTEQGVYYLSSRGSNFSYLMSFINFKAIINKELKLGAYENLYLASIDSRFFHYIISVNNSSRVYTFDDGAANIVKNSIYYNEDNPRLLKRILWKFLGVNIYMGDVIKISKKHFTIYDKLSNIIKNTETLTLFNRKDSDFCFEGEDFIIYLGQPVEELVEDFNFKSLEQFLIRKNVKYYFPHPREKNIPKFDNLRVVQSCKIFEDYLLDMIEQKKICKIKVYSFLSSALLNVKGFPSVEVFFIHDFKIYEKYVKFYREMNHTFFIENISIINEGE